jgi:hypothetical protein
MEWNTAYEQVQGTKFMLVGRYMWSIGTDISFEDLTSTADEALVRAWRGFDSTKAKWNTHAYNYINGYLLNLINRYSKIGKVGQEGLEGSEGIYINCESEFKPNDDGYDQFDKVCDDSDEDYNSVLNSWMYAEDSKHLSKNEREIVTMILDGYDIGQIAKSQKLSKVKLIQKYEKMIES